MRKGDPGKGPPEKLFTKLFRQLPTDVSKMSDKILTVGKGEFRTISDKSRQLSDEYPKKKSDKIVVGSTDLIQLGLSAGKKNPYTTLLQRQDDGKG